MNVTFFMDHKVRLSRMYLLKARREMRPIVATEIFILDKKKSSNYIVDKRLEI